MIERNLSEWSGRYNSHEPLWPRGGVAPLRHDLALARYLEQQAEHRALSACPRADKRQGAPTRLYARLVHGSLAVLRALRTPLPERPRNWTS